MLVLTITRSNILPGTFEIDEVVLELEEELVPEVGEVIPKSPKLSAKLAMARNVNTRANILALIFILPPIIEFELK